MLRLRMLEDAAFGVDGIDDPVAVRAYSHRSELCVVTSSIPY